MSKLIHHAPDLTVKKMLSKQPNFQALSSIDHIKLS